MSALTTILALSLAAASPRERPPTLGEAPVAPGGSPLAPLLGDDVASPWRFALSTGVAGKFGGRKISANEDNRSVLLFFGGQADGSWPDGHGQTARLRFRLFTGGESDIYVPSDGEAELAWAVGRREFRFVLARVEVARQPGLALQTLAQAGTLPCFEGTLSLAGEDMQLSYFVSPVEAAWVRYYGGAHLAHLPGWNTEDDRPSAASAGRLRYSVLLPAAVALSLQGDLAKFWGKADLLLALEGSVGYQLPRQGAAFHVGVRWANYTRRGLARDTRETSAEVMAVGSATLAF
jgi:hypothetical protein